MVTGASKADVFVILIDARKGILEQTHRHYFIANLLRLRQVVVCVNKMDLVNYSQQVFLSIKSEFEKFAAGIKVAEQQITFIPVSSLFGENITAPATAMPWYQGAPLLTVLESTEVHNDTETRPARFPVQWVVRPRTESHHDYRGYAGQLTTGVLYPGDEVLVLPSQQKTHIASIEKFGASLQQARAGDSVVLTLTSQVDVSRGDVLVRASEAPELKKEWHSTVCWMDATPMVPGKNYLLLHGTAQIRARVETLFHEIHPSLQEKRQTTQLRLNQIGYIKLRSARPLPIESYSKNAATGSFALLDEFTHNTVAVGFAE
jgi:sulfate adenylyltransferase subunit 1